MLALLHKSPNHSTLSTDLFPSFNSSDVAIIPSVDTSTSKNIKALVLVSEILATYFPDI